MDYRHMAQLIKRRTGGLSVSPHIVAHHTEPNTYNQVGFIVVKYSKKLLNVSY